MTRAAARITAWSHGVRLIDEERPGKIAVPRFSIHEDTHIQVDLSVIKKKSIFLILVHHRICLLSTVLNETYI